MTMERTAKAEHSTQFEIARNSRTGRTGAVHEAPGAKLGRSMSTQEYKELLMPGRRPSVRSRRDVIGEKLTARRSSTRH